MTALRSSAAALLLLRSKQRRVAISENRRGIAAASRDRWAVAKHTSGGRYCSVLRLCLPVHPGSVEAHTHARTPYLCASSYEGVRRTWCKVASIPAFITCTAKRDETRLCMLAGKKKLEAVPSPRDLQPSTNPAESSLKAWCSLPAALLGAG